MALANYPESKEKTNHKKIVYPQVQYPLQEGTQDAAQEQSKILQWINQRSPFSISKKRMVSAISLLVVLVFSIAAYGIINKIHQTEYHEALELLQVGKYDQGKELLEKLGNYKDVKTIQEQMKYESIVYNCIAPIKQKLENYIPYEIEFYKSLDHDAKPVCFMHYGAQYGFNGLSEEYAIFEYSKEDKHYYLVGKCDSPGIARPGELAMNDLDGSDSEVSKEEKNNSKLVKQEIEKYAGAQNVGNIDLQRVETVLKNDAYASIKIID